MWIFKKLADGYSYFLDTKIGKAWTVLTSTAVGRLATLATIILPLTGVTLFGLAAPVMPALLIPISVIAIVGVVAGAVIDTLRTRRVRLLLKECKHLEKLKITIESKEKLKVANPHLAFLLESNNHNLSQTGKKYKIEEKNKKYYIPDAVTKALLNQSVFIPFKIVSNIYNPISLIKVAVFSIIGIGLEAKSRYDFALFKYKIKDDINKLREGKPNAPEKISELIKLSKKERIEKLAFEKLVKENRLHLSDDQLTGEQQEQIQQRFNQIKEEIKKRIYKKNILSRLGYCGDFIRAHNPFSKLNDADKLKTESDKDNIAKKMFKKEKAWEDKVEGIMPVNIKTAASNNEVNEDLKANKTGKRNNAQPPKSNYINNILIANEQNSANKDILTAGKQNDKKLFVEEISSNKKKPNNNFVDSILQAGGNKKPSGTDQRESVRNSAAH